jgi:hypothetical protein
LLVADEDDGEALLDAAALSPGWGDSVIGAEDCSPAEELLLFCIEPQAPRAAQISIRESFPCKRDTLVRIICIPP